MKILTVVLALLLTACTTTPQGKSIDRSNYADLGSTAIALSQGAAEANPLGAALIPIKLGMGYGIERHWADNCIARAELAQMFNAIYYGATANNLLVATSVSAAPIVGIVAGIAYYNNNERIEPDTFSCIPDIDSLEAFAKAYSEGNSKAISAAFAPNAITSDSVGIEAIEADYAQFFAGTEVRWVKWRTYDPETGKGEIWTWVDGKSGPHDVSVTYSDTGKISSMTW